MTVWSAARWVGLGAVVGVLAGVSSAAFLATLEVATRTREDHPWLLYGLPLAGLVVGAAAHHLAGGARTGAALVVDEVHSPTGWLPRRLAPLVYLGTIVTHLFGGSAGREGTAIQLSGSLADLTARWLRLTEADRRVMLTAALSGGFGAVFGVPLAGAVFGLEVQHTVRAALRARRAGHPRAVHGPERVIASVVAPLVGDAVVRLLGVTHTQLPLITADVGDVDVFVPVVLTGAGAGLVALAFVALTHHLKDAFATVPGWPPLRPALGGAAVVAFTLALGTNDYLGLSLPLATTALAGAGVATLAFALKLVFTAVTVGSGFPGGEVTPLFVMGATLGATVAAATAAPAPLLAAVGFVAVFAGAAEVPVACTVMACELFGVDALPLFALGCGLAWACSTARGIYPAPPVTTAAGGPP